MRGALRLCFVLAGWRERWQGLTRLMRGHRQAATPAQPRERAMLRLAQWWLLRARAALCRAVRLVLVTAVALGLVLLAVLAALHEAPQVFVHQHQRHARPAVTDRNGDLIGAAPSLQAAAAGRDGDPGDDELRMAALMVDEVPPVWWEVAVALEDRHFDRPPWFYGIDVFALRHAIAGRRGASTLAMQVTSNLLGDKAREYSARGWARAYFRYKRKLRELASTPSLVAATAADDYRWLKRLAATHLPVMHGQIGGSTVGIASAGWILFGKTPLELSPGEQAVLAAALKHNILVKRQPDEAVRATWQRVRQRARHGLTLAYATGDPRRVLGMAQIDAMPELPPLFFHADRRLPLSARAHVVHRRLYTGGPAAIQAQAELTDRYGLTALADLPLRGYALTLDADENFRFKLRMDQVAESLGAELGHKCRLFLPLGRATAHQTPCATVPGVPAAERAQVLTVLANGRGEVVRFYQSGSTEPIYAGVQGRNSPDGRYDPTAEIRDIGSIAKVAAAVLLAGEGDTADSLYCRHGFAGRLDSDGSTGHADCKQPGAMIPARAAFARSSSLALLWRLQQVPRVRLQALAADLGLQLPADVDPAYALAFGQVRASPQRVHTLMHAVGRLALGLAAMPQPVHIVGRLDADAHDPAPAPAEPARLAGIRLARDLATPQARQFVRDVLGAVVAHPQGTLRFLAGLAPGGTAVTAHLAKTGTPVNGANQATDKFVTGALLHRGRYFSYLLLVRAPHPGPFPLGQGLTAQDFRPLLDALLQQVAGAQLGDAPGNVGGAAL